MAIALMTKEAPYKLERLVLPKRLLVDIDGVICDYDFKFLVKKHFGVDLSPLMLYAYDLADVLGVAPALINTMFKEQVYGEPKFNKGAIKTMQSWVDEGYSVIIYSNRIKYMGYEGLEEWLIKYKVPFTEIDGGQGAYNYHIDDSPAKLASTDSSKKLLYTQAWNTRCLDIHKSFIRVNNWDEIRKVIGE